MLAICRVDMLMDVWGPEIRDVKKNNTPANQMKSYREPREKKGKKVIDKRWKKSLKRYQPQSEQKMKMGTNAGHPAKAVRQ